MAEEIITTLYEGHYDYGVASLANSLVKSGFSGLLLIGYRGNLPFWLNQLKKQDDLNYILNDSISVTFVKIESGKHFGYYKPEFLREALTSYPECSSVYYFDPDIVVNAPWQFFTNWVKCGISLCLDNAFPFVHPNHPWRAEWRTLSSNSEDLKSTLSHYVNSGFIGLKRNDALILDKWIDLTKAYQLMGGDISQFEKDGHRSFKGDQDLLNAALTVTPEIELSIIGTEGMGFTLPAYLMTHAVYDIKPWRKNFLKILLVRGHKPNTGDMDFLRYCQHPIRLYSNSQMRVKKFNYKMASVLSRLL
jgi:hypothetical protein